MQITEIRKEIINLISDYMDKTLSEWCIILWNLHINWEPVSDSSIEYKTITWNIEKANNWITYIYSNWQEYDVYKIIGHYDITAVTKYFSYFDFQIESIDLLEDTISIYNKNNLDEVYFIPNKPLHLYTDEEDEQLLNLLLKLKWQ